MYQKSLTFIFRCSESAGRRGLAADLLNESVVTPARTYRSLRTEAFSHPFKNSAIVIVQAAHQTRIHAKRDAGGTQRALQRRKRLQRFVIEIIHELRRRGNHCLQRRVLAVEYA